MRQSLDLYFVTEANSKERSLNPCSRNEEDPEEENCKPYTCEQDDQ